MLLEATWVVVILLMGLASILLGLYLHLKERVGDLECRVVDLERAKWLN